MKAEPVKQRTDDWLKLRRGKFTASEIHKLMDKKFGDELEKWTIKSQNYILEKVAESFSSQSQPLTSVELRWGIEYEPIGLAHYEGVFKEEIQEIGFVLWSENTSCGCSPDGDLKGKPKGIELKCPYTLRSHMEAMMIRSNADFKQRKPQWYWQVMSSMMFCKYDVWDFVSFHPYFNPEQRLSCIEIVRDDKEFTYMKERLNAAVILRDKLIQKIKADE